MISVILATYNRPDALKLVLEGYERVRGVEFEVLVADDGSTSETRDLVETVAREASFRLVHLWQEDAGFRLAAVRNLAARNARGEILMFTDGDCIPFPDCLLFHARECRAGVVHAGARCLLNEKETAQILAGEQDVDAVYREARRRDEGKLRRLWLKNRFYRATRLKSRPKLLTANAAVHRDDFEAVNGFDERFEGWGYEDEDLTRRLRRLEVRAVDGTRECLVLHLFHPVHVSHRPDARAGENYRYFRRGHFLTRALRGLQRRRVEDLRLRLCGAVPGMLQSISVEEGTRPEVIVHFHSRPSRGLRRHAEVVLRIGDEYRFDSGEHFYEYLEEVL